MKDLLDSNSKTESVLDKEKAYYDFNVNNRLKVLINEKDNSFNKDKIKEWAKKNNATELFLNLWDIYNNLYKSCGSINPIIAYIQAAIATDFGNFNSDLKEAFNNPYGVKEFKYDDEGVLSEDYTKFASWEEGVEAHLDHLALYFGAEGYPKDNSKDTRHFYYLYGICSDILDLQDKWTTKKEYSNRILSELEDIYNNCNSRNIKVVNSLSELETLKSENKLLKDKLDKYDKLINSLKNILDNEIE